MKITRFNRTTYTLSGTVDFKTGVADADVCLDQLHYYSNNWKKYFLFQCELKVYYSSKGNNQFVLLPYKIQRTTCCKFFESYYWKVIEKALADTSDLPKREGNEPICLKYKV